VATAAIITSRVGGTTALVTAAAITIACTIWPTGLSGEAYFEKRPKRVRADCQEVSYQLDRKVVAR